MTTCCTVYSPHEQRIQEEMLGKNDFKKGRERIYKILESFNTQRPIIDVERAKYFTESIKEIEHEA